MKSLIAFFSVLGSLNSAQAASQCLALDPETKTIVYEIEIQTLPRTDDNTLVIGLPSNAFVSLKSATKTETYQTTFSSHTQFTRCGPYETSTASLGNDSYISFVRVDDFSCGFKHDSATLTVGFKSPDQKIYELKCKGL